MGYRKGRNNDPFYKWRVAHTIQLIELGIPEAIVKSHDRFLFILQEGWDPTRKWDVSWIEEENVGPLLQLLREQFEDWEWDMMGHLHQRLVGTWPLRPISD